MNIIVDSKFNPFTYDELVRPLVDYTTAYKELESQYENLAAQTETFSDIGAQDANKEAYSMYDNYAKDLQAAVDDFSQGMTLSNRKALLGLKRRYYKEIAPIARAEEAFKEERQRRDDFRKADPSIKFKDSEIGVDSFLHGKRPSEDFISGNAIVASTSAKAEALAKAMFSDPEFASKMNGQYIQIAQQNGLSPDLFLNIIQGNIDNNPDLSDELKTKLKGFSNIMTEELEKVEGWGQEVQDFVKGQVITGMYAGLADPVYSYQRDLNFVDGGTRAQIAQRNAEFEYQKTRDKKNDEKEAIATGEAPYFTDANGNKYHSNATATWTVDSNGNVKDLKYRRAYSGGTDDVDTSSINMSDIYIDGEYSYDSGLRELPDSTKYDEDDSEQIMPSQLTDYAKEYIEDQLPDGLTLKDVRIYSDGDHLKVVKKKSNSGSANAGL